MSAFIIITTGKDAGSVLVYHHLSVAVIGVIHYLTRFMAIKLISPTLVSFIRTSEIVLAYVIQLVILGTKPYLTSLIGSGLVLVACIAIIFERS